MDLCSGLGIDSVVFVDLDAVMLELLFEPRCKWLESEAGGQPLLVFAALERLWADLQTCQDLSCGRLQVLDFTEQGSAWRQPSLKLLRLSIFGFLSAYGVPMHKVSSWSCPDFQQLLQRCNTAFVLTSDASQSNPEWAAKHKDVEIVACCLAAQAAYGSASGLWNSAFISHLGVMEGRAFGFRTMSLRPSKAAKARALNFASAALKDVQQSQQSISSSLPGSGPGQGIGNTTSNPGCFEAAAADPARPGKSKPASRTLCTSMCFNPSFIKCTCMKPEWSEHDVCLQAFACPMPVQNAQKHHSVFILVGQCPKRQSPCGPLAIWSCLHYP